MTLVPIFIMAASSGPEAGRGAGAASFLDSSSTVAEPACAHKFKSSSLLSVLGPRNKTIEKRHQPTPPLLKMSLLVIFLTSQYLPMSLSILCVRANMPEFSKRLKLLDPCFRDSMCIIARRKRACGMVPRLGPAGFSLVMVCKGTGCTPGNKSVRL